MANFLVQDNFVQLISKLVSKTWIESVNFELIIDNKILEYNRREFNGIGFSQKTSWNFDRNSGDGSMRVNWTEERSNDILFVGNVLTKAWKVRLDCWRSIKLKAKNGNWKSLFK